MADAEEALEAHGALAVTLTDRADDPVLEPAPGEAPLWPSVELRALFPLEVDRERLRDVLGSLPGVQPPPASAWCRVEDRDWERAWMDRFRPMRFGQDLWIVPTGMEAPADAGLVLALDPGLAFGTGTHPTTALCLEWIDGRSFSGLRVLDYGCGSGVLGIAAALKGADEVLCIDNDPQALTATERNAARNGVAERLDCAAPELIRPTGFDVVLANILAGPLMSLAPTLGSALAPSGHIVLSGILPEQADEVAEAYRAAVGRMYRVEQDGWVRLAGAASSAGGAK